MLAQPSLAKRERESNPAIANHSMHSGCNLICAFSSYIYNILFSIVHCDQTISYLTCYFKKQFIDTENCRPVSLYTYLSHAWVIGIICNSQLNTLRYPIWKQKAFNAHWTLKPYQSYFHYHHSQNSSIFFRSGNSETFWMCTYVVVIMNRSVFQL